MSKFNPDAMVQRYPDKEHVTIHRDFLRALAQGDISKSELRALMSFLADLTSDKYRRIHKKRLAENLGVAPSSISKGTTRLENRGIIIAENFMTDFDEDDDDEITGRPGYYIINDRYLEIGKNRHI
ncbi:hypothetical protein [Selenomonas ruminantium]|uniref:Uncharacterized protein n=1 Tax=Selenomonas ruminantium TaxID=971 RepID=A0A1I0YFJ1_SELRU|nr:hypothetical protein [Selenomonas ruminantium]SFB10953.1 hypothetical protein SAMN05216587_111114 [Selenomonas ruminantium]